MLQHLVVIVPGIGGSRLVDRDGMERWGGNPFTFAANVLIPDMLSLDLRPHLAPRGLLSSARHLPGLAVIHPYDGLVKKLTRAFANVVYDDATNPKKTNLRANLVAFPYDFRRSIVEASERLGQEVDVRRKALEVDGVAPQVIVVAHSMGGLIARHWLGARNGWPVCDGLLTLGTPHRGAPKAVDWIVNGARIKGLRLDSATKVLRSWPSVYELLPRYEAVMVRRSADPADDGPRYPKDLGLPELGDAATRAFKVHEEIETGWGSVLTGSGGVRFRPTYGHGHKTTQALHLDGKVLTASTDAATWLADPGFDGDATVPQFSAIPIELADDEDRWADSSERHGGLPDAAGVVEFVRSITAPSTRAIRGDDDDERCVIGTDIEETILGGDELSIGIEMIGYDDDIDDSAWDVTLTRLDGPTGPMPVATSVEASGSSAVIRSGPLNPGEYQIRIGAVLDVEQQPRPVQEFLLAVDSEVQGP